jgi:small-conductance mechanosensitive channel
VDDTLSTVAPIALVLVLTGGGLGLGWLARAWMIRRASRPGGERWAGVFIAALRGPIVLWPTMIGTYLAADLVSLPGTLGPVVGKVLVVLLIASVTWALARVAAAAVHARAASAGALPSANLVAYLARLVVLILGGLILLQTLGVSITPLVTALGVGGLAVGLALQDTLANLFAGVHILASRQVRPGDFIRLDTGDEGHVVDVTWRYTTVRQLRNALTIVPNAKLASAVITNYSLPDDELAVLVPVGVSYDSNLSQVEAVTAAVGREVMATTPGAVPEFEPFIRYNGFGDSSITFNVILRGRTAPDQHVIRHEFIKRLHERYRAEGIEIPFPIRTVHLHPRGPAPVPQA